VKFLDKVERAERIVVANGAPTWPNVSTMASWHRQQRAAWENLGGPPRPHPQLIESTRPYSWAWPEHAIFAVHPGAFNVVTYAHELAHMLDRRYTYGRGEGHDGHWWWLVREVLREVGEWSTAIALSAALGRLG
jgi:hypothetical protein